MGLIKNQLQKQIDNNALTNYGVGIGTIVSFDKLSNTATLKYQNPHGEGYKIQSGVKVSIAYGGVMSESIKPGTKCSIVFNTNITTPTIVGIISNPYVIATSTDQGAYLINRDILSLEIPEVTEAMTEQWIDNNNTIDKYAEYAEKDIETDVYNMLNNLDKYGDEESGITNLHSKATVKTTDNGDIEMFVANNVGMRVSTTDHKIYLYGQDIYFNDEQITNIVEEEKQVSQEIAKPTYATITTAINAKAYKPRLSAPLQNDKHWIHYTAGGYNSCIKVNGNWCLPNCVGYAQGRWLELLNAKAVNWKLPACNAEDWIEAAQKSGFIIGKTPKLGAVICWAKGLPHNGSDGYGHVAVVEEIKDNGDIVISQSGYRKYTGEYWPNFYTSTITKASGYSNGTGYTFRGFIYLGIDFTNIDINEK